MLFILRTTLSYLVPGASVVVVVVVVFVTCSMYVLMIYDCCPDEGTPPPFAPSAWLATETNVVGGWCCCTHIFGVETNYCWNIEQMEQSPMQ